MAEHEGQGTEPGGRLPRWLDRFDEDDSGATALEWTLLLAAIALPSYFIIRLGLDLLIAHYELIVTINELPVP